MTAGEEYDEDVNAFYIPRVEGDDNIQLYGVISLSDKDNRDIPAKYERPKVPGTVPPRDLSPLGPSTQNSLKRTNNKSSVDPTTRRRNQLMAELSATDKHRAVSQHSPADELMWLNFETQMRGVVRSLLEPVVEIS